MLIGRIIWQLYPYVWCCALFWLAALFDQWSLRKRIRHWVPFYIAWLGMASNALVTLANHGSMPVVGLLASPMSVWSPATSTSHLLWLADRYAGFSIGDFVILTSIATRCAYWIAGSPVLRRSDG